MKKVIISVSWAALIFTSGCHHKPVYPEYGSIYISTDPPGAEVLIDGEMTYRMTPVKMDGISTGYHEFTLRCNHYKTMNFSLEIKPGQTRMVFKELSKISLLKKDTLVISAEDMDIIEDKGEIYLTKLWDSNIVIVKINEDGQLSVKTQIEVGGGQRLITVNSSANKAFFTMDNTSEVVGLDLLSQKIIRAISLKNVKYYSTLKFSPDGNIVVAGDSLNKRLVVIDSRLCSIIKTIDISGCPTDISFDRGNPQQVYVTQSGAKVFSLINLESQEVIKSIPTGNSPGAIFWNNDSTTIGFCNRKDCNFTIADVDDWVPATSERNLSSNFIFDAVWSGSDDYLLYAMDYVLGTIYMPSWKQYTRINNAYNLLIRILLIKNKKLLLMLNEDNLITVELSL